MSFTEQEYLYRVTGHDGKIAVLWAKNKKHASERFAAEFFVGSTAATVVEVV